VDPKKMWYQTGWFLLPQILITFTPLWWFSVVAAGLLFAWWLAWNLHYARSLASRGRSPRRVTGDRRVSLQVTVVLLVTLACALTAGLVPIDYLGTPASPLACAAVVVLLLVYGSSVFDWYYIRPRLDGVVIHPPCQTSGDPVWIGVTQKWFANRSICDILCSAGGGMGFVFACYWIYSAFGPISQLPPIVRILLSLAGGIAGAGGKILVGNKNPWVALRHNSISPPNYALGTDVYDGPGPRGFIRDVSAHQVTLVRWLVRANDWKIDPVSLVDMRDQRFQFGKQNRCSEDECRGYNRVKSPAKPSDDPAETNECEWSKERFQAQERKKLLVI
jgi:hypothetical protein